MPSLGKYGCGFLSTAWSSFLGEVKINIIVVESFSKQHPTHHDYSWDFVPFPSAFDGGYSLSSSLLRSRVEAWRGGARIRPDARIDATLSPLFLVRFSKVLGVATASAELSSGSKIVRVGC